MFDWWEFSKMFLVLFGVLCAVTFSIIAVALENAWWMLGALLGIVSMSAAVALGGW